MNVFRHFAVYFTLLIAAMLCGGQLRAQTITVTTTNTPTVCFNDGTLTINATGGTGPYTDTILSGPAGPNLSYPIVLPTGQNVFTNLTHGSYTVVVHDAAGHSTTVTASVGGTYQFPTLLIQQFGLTASTSGLVAIVTGGRAPYQYALSATNSSSGFGPYQSLDTFRGMCPGTYWLRVRDNCGNIFTSPQSYSYNLWFTLNCVNYSGGILNVSTQGGHPPYTYVYSNYYPTFSDTNRTGVFTGLPHYFNGTVIVTDSCGVSGGFLLGPLPANLFTNCPFDSNIYYGSQVNYGDTFTFICTSCNPRQTTTITSQQNAQVPNTIFRHLSSPSISYIVLKNQNSQCGADTVQSNILFGTSPYHLSQQYISCKSFGYKVKDSAGNVIPVDSFVLTGPNGFRKVDTIGLYFDLAFGGYTLVAYIRGAVGCIASLNNYFQVPKMPQVCYYLMEDSSCHATYLGRMPTVSSPEKFTFLIPHTGGRSDTVPLLPYGAYDVGYALPPATNINLMSDSGCSEGLSVPQVPTPSVSAVTPCVGAPFISFTNPYSNFCTGYSADTVLVKFYHHDSLTYTSLATYSSSTTGFYLRDTGWYHYEYYQTILPSVGDPAHQRYDTICPLDSGSVYLTNSHIPYPSPTTVYTACDTVTAAPVIYTITGGTAPYTVQIPGQDTVTVNGHTGTFPTRHIGTYTMIVYDYCGISRSYTFSILDTCTAHICPRVSAGPDVSICAGSAYTLHAQPAVYVPGAHYLWQPGGDTTATLIVRPAVTTPYIVTMTLSGCTPVADTVVVNVSTPPTLTISHDTAICIGRNVLLTATPSQTGGQYLWTPGNLSTQSINIAPAATTTYHLKYTLGQCINSSDSVVVTVANPALSLSVHDTSLCAGSSLLIGSSVSQAGGSYLWTPDGVAAPSLLLNPATRGTHTLSYTLSGCSAKDSVRVHVGQPLTLTGSNASVCNSAAATLTATPSVQGGHYLWSTGDTTAGITVSPIVQTVYTLTYTTACGSATAADTVFIGQPPVISAANAAICQGAVATLTAATTGQGGHYLWSTGDTTASINISPTVQTVYTLTYTTACGIATAADTVFVRHIPVISSANTAICSGAIATLTAATTGQGGHYLWSTGDTTASITVSPTVQTVYTLTYTTACGSATAADTVFVGQPPVISSANTAICSGAIATLTAATTGQGGHYLWSTGDTTASITVSPTVQTVYTLTYTTACGSATAADTVFTGQAPVISAANAAICQGAVATLTAATSSQGGHYLWSTADTTASISVSPDTTTIYTVVYTSACGTAQVSDTVFVSAAPAISLADTTICAGQTATLSAVVSAPGGQYAWSTGDRTPTISITPVTTAYVSVSYTIAGCAAVSANDTVTVYPLPLLTLSPAGVSCYGLNDGSVTANVSPAGSYSYHWADGSNSAADTGLTPGAYTLTVTDAHHCSVSGSATVLGAAAASLISLPADTTVHQGQPVQLSTLFGGYPVSSITAYQWTPAWGLNCDSCPAPVASLPDGDTLAVYTVIVTYSNGCRVSASDTIHVNTSEGMTTPDAFSPNGDGVNDTYIIHAYGVAVFHMNIYNRWGELVFTTDDIRNGWDGTYRGKSQPSEIYEVFISIAYLNGQAANVERNIMLLR